jgi:Ca2+-binding RTX toxin-like protein
MATINGNDDDNVLRGTIFADQIFGFDGEDRIVGLTGNDKLDGGLGDDHLFGDFGNDILIGGSGFDRLDGGAGTDTADYSASAEGVTLFLDSADQLGQVDDELVSVENVVGSAFRDIIHGSADPNVLSGGDGSDLLDGRGGADTLDGGNGSDAVIYILSPAGVIVDLSLDAGLGGDATNDHLISIENVIGSAFADTLIGDDEVNGIEGRDGADRLIGGRGDDRISGGAGPDTFVWRNIKESGTAVHTMDVVFDFDPLEGDLIDLAGVDASAVAAGNQAFTFIGAAAFSGTPGEINFIHLEGETIIQLQTGIEGDIEMGIRIRGILTPEASWFVL